MKHVGGDELREYVVWVPILGSTSSDVPAATRLVDDPRARHFWDRDGAVAIPLGLRLDLRIPAWDVYLLYGPDARWDERQPPAPLFWMHQLSSHAGVPPGTPRLDAGEFSKRVRATIAR